MRSTEMLVINDQISSDRQRLDTDAFTRRQLMHAQSGRISLTELAQSHLSYREVAKFLVGQIPILRAAALGGKLETLGLLLEEIHRALLPKIESENKKSKIR
jgi:hypothetical protein